MNAETKAPKCTPFFTGEIVSAKWYDADQKRVSMNIESIDESTGELVTRFAVLFAWTVGQFNDAYAIDPKNMIDHKIRIQWYVKDEVMPEITDKEGNVLYSATKVLDDYKLANNNTVRIYQTEEEKSLRLKMSLGLLNAAAPQAPVPTGTVIDDQTW